jgi:hypothetical protein
MARKFKIRAAPSSGKIDSGHTDQLSTQAAEDRARQLEREQGTIAELRKALALFDEDYGRGAENRALTTAASGLITSGLGNTTRPGAVSAGLSAQFEDMRRGRLSDALSNLASFMGSYRDPTMVTPGLAQQGKEQDRRFLLDQQQANIARPTPSSRPTFTPGPISLATPEPTETNYPDIYTESINGSLNNIPNPYVNTGNPLGNFDPAAANARLGNTLQTPTVPNESWFNWQDPLSFEGLNLG